MRYLPPYSPDLNLIELAFSKFKKLLRDGAEQTVDKLWNSAASPPLDQSSGDILFVAVFSEILPRVSSGRRLLRMRSKFSGTAYATEGEHGVQDVTPYLVAPESCISGAMRGSLSYRIDTDCRSVQRRYDGKCSLLRRVELSFVIALSSDSHMSIDRDPLHFSQQGTTLSRGLIQNDDNSRSRIQHPTGVVNRLAWRYVIPIAIMHSLAILACLPYFFSWTGVALLVFGIRFYGDVGINLCYHRMLSHRSFRCPRWLEHWLVVVALCCLEDAPASWIATHRLHHHDADLPTDPHSPLVGFFWSHIGWLLFESHDIRCMSAYDRFARDILRDPFYKRLERTYLSVWIYVGHALIYLVLGLLAGGVMTGSATSAVQFGLGVVVWGVVLRTVCVWHLTWSVNSLTHLFGYRSYETSENSRNNWLVAYFTHGEGWHNNHHHDPASASNTHRWWELDPVFGLICLMQKMGLASDVIRPRHERKSAQQAIDTSGDYTDEPSITAEIRKKCPR